jgi:hypothetical protein
MSNPNCKYAEMAYLFDFCQFPRIGGLADVNNQLNSKQKSSSFPFAIVECAQNLVSES